MKQYTHRFASGVTLEVTRQGRERDTLMGGTREVWQLRLFTSSTEYIDTIRSGVGGLFDPEEAAYVALGFLGAYLEAKACYGGNGESENADLFPSWVAASIDIDEVQLLEAELGYDDEGEARW